MDTPKPYADHFGTVLTRGLVVIVFNVVIGLGLALRNDNMVVQMVYAQAIGLSIWLTIECARHAFKRDPRSNWPVGWRRYVLLVGGILVGYTIGTAIGDAFSGYSTWNMMLAQPRQTLGYLFLAFTMSGVITFFFHARGRGASLEQLAATAQRDASQAQLQLLSSQLEPHMLFNTLANAHALIDTEPARAQQMLEALSELLHASMQTGEQSLVTLQQEFTLVEQYLKLMAIRMGPRLRQSLVLPADLQGARLPPLSLQPLVENAVRHGLDARAEGGSITVTARREGAHVVVDVLDDGQGLSVADPFAAGRIGLANLRQRLAYAFGDDAGFTLVDHAPHGVRATVRIPHASPA